VPALRSILMSLGNVGAHPRLRAGRLEGGRWGSFMAIFVLLTSIGGRVYPLPVKCGTDSKLKGRDRRVARKCDS